MIARLQDYIMLENKKWMIRTDYRVVLDCFEAFNDIELSDIEKWIVCLKNMIVEYDTLPLHLYESAMTEINHFIAIDFDESQKIQKPLLNWEQDEQMIFSAINTVAKMEVRAVEYMHWWTFLGYFNNIGECLFSTVIHIRSKKSKGKKLEKYEQEFYKENKNIIDIQRSKQMQEIINEEKKNILKKIGMG
jgi:Bacteriophage Gp15 protein